MTNTRLINLGVVLLAVLVAGWLAVTVSSDDDGTTEGPVIADRDAGGYDTAEIMGRLRLENNCLTIDGDVVVWPHGTTWDEGSEAVVFGDEFEDVSEVRVGDYFIGAGGYHENGDVERLDESIREAVEACLAKTGSSTVVVAHPGLE